MALCVHGIVCGYKHDWAPAASNKDFIYMVALKEMVCKDSGPARLGSDRVGSATERVGNWGDSAGGLGR